MNKSKLVMLAASAMFAITLNFSACSGEDGTSCTLEGNKLTCGDKTLIINDGEKGDNGDDGIGCTLDQDAEGKGPATITCGTNPPLIIPMCNGEIYSLAKNVCDNNGNLYSIVTIGTKTWMKENLKNGTGDKFTWAQANVSCPNGWSLPSKADFDVLVVAADFAGKWSDDNGRWWGEERNSNNAYVLIIEDGEFLEISQTGNKVTPESVRCLKD